MPKYDYKFKKQCVENYLKDKSLPKIKGVSPNTIERYVCGWRLLFREQGEEGLSNSIIFKDYSVEDKIKAVRRVLKGESCGEVARSIGMRCHSTVRRWVIAYSKYGVTGLQYRRGSNPMSRVDHIKSMKENLTHEEKEELINLRERNKILEAENIYLKKLRALVSKRKKRESKAKKQK